MSYTLWWTVFLNHSLQRRGFARNMVVRFVMAFERGMGIGP